jgi:hypothetical protein
MSRISSPGRGIIVSYETIRQWCEKFSPDYARKLYPATRIERTPNLLQRRQLRMGIEHVNGSKCLAQSRQLLGIRGKILYMPKRSCDDSCQHTAAHFLPQRQQIRKQHTVHSVRIGYCLIPPKQTFRSTLAQFATKCSRWR